MFNKEISTEDIYGCSTKDYLIGLGEVYKDKKTHLELLDANVLRVGAIIATLQLEYDIALLVKNKEVAREMYHEHPSARNESLVDIIRERLASKQLRLQYRHEELDAVLYGER